jgi:hypothetical protein
MAPLPEFYNAVADTISGLCTILLEHDGDLPMATPSWPSARPSPLVQLCHGTPGLLLLLATAAGNKPFATAYWRNEWNRAIDVGSDKIWREGLLSKGAGLCHGIAGNALPLLLIARSMGSRDLGPRLLGKALKMLCVAQEATPITQTKDAARVYRTPDNPNSLFEGLAGTIWAWVEACIAINEVLQDMQAKRLSNDNGGNSSVAYALPGRFPGF